MARKKRVLLLIDGSNFYYKLKDLGLSNLLEFDFSGFVESLVEEGRLIRAGYYIGKVRDQGSKKGKKMHADQQRLFAKLKEHGLYYSLGFLLKTDGVYHEKGVDVNMAVDMVVAAYEDEVDKILLLSSDTDLLPAVRVVKEKGKEVEYVGFSRQPSLALVANCTESRLLKKKDLVSFVKGRK